MARTKQAAPIQREPTSEYVGKEERAAALRSKSEKASGHGRKTNETGEVSVAAAGIQQVVIAVAGIYGSLLRNHDDSLTWGYLQEKLTTTAHAAPMTTASSSRSSEVFHFPVFLNTVQSAMAAVTGLLYLWAATPRGCLVPPIVPSLRLLGPLLLVALTSSLASPFGYAALGHIDYITYILAKSCKLLPVMFLHVTIFRRRYPLYKYLVVAAVTAGVAVFTLHTGSRHGKSSSSASGQRSWGLLLLGVNLLFDGLTNSTQDYIFDAFRPFSGPQMMCANSLMQTAVTGAYLLAVNPWLVHSGVGAWLGAVDESAAATGGELAAALAFLQRHPSVWRDVLGFAACGAVGQIFIFYALSTFSSVFLVTVTVTRKMCTMILSVVAFGHRLSHMQWLGVALVFGGIGVEAQIARSEKMKKQAQKTAKAQ
ncbi:udp-glc gal endoplasmic reticulum nucleotide sugar transporter [Grosmannia clavigera kw1407]|uniref:UDP-galactose transporter homolog 1 n=1 Tax=Grosmannia clavigera (strain kw1407 / UAMH 11150) TaxID=655863 RepID=F0XQ58_GROCL|nr:udp-glc gal endoplasmic reticulum nucleotide sugar transporter [Grosmannia clavigera kw1407]EFX00632.1 udp-glc gal endoplasmic reticulum nucleotide sugar transporter [Grosmannia clavigera kw1407]